MNQVIPVTMEVVDQYTRSYLWVGLGAGDWGEPVSAWAWPNMVWQLTGHITENTDRASIHILGSNDYTCYSRLHTMVPISSEDDPPIFINGVDGPLAHNWTDYAVDGSNFPRMRWVTPRRPRDGGTHNDLAIFLFCSRSWPVRGDLA